MLSKLADGVYVYDILAKFDFKPIHLRHTRFFLD